MEHLAIMDEKTIRMILDGKKLIESRFSKNKIAPFGTVKEGNLIYLKVSGGSVKAVFTAGPVIYFDGLNNHKVQMIKKKYNDRIKANDEFWGVKEHSNYGTLIEIRNPLLITPFSIKKLGRQAFISYEGDLKAYYLSKN